MSTQWERFRVGRVGRRAAGLARRLEDAGQLVVTGRAPQRRAPRPQPVTATPRPEGAPAGPPEATAAPIFFGWTRYSAYHPKSRAFVAVRDAEDEATYKAQLWSAERMRTRSAIFFGLSVPQLHAMRGDHDYVHLVTYSDDMPDPWQAELQDAVAASDLLALHPVHRGLRFLIRDHLVATGSPSRPVVTFRVDDDDLLATNYLDELAAYATAHDHGRAVSLARGYTALWHAGAVTQLRSTYRRLGSQGQACIGSWDAETGELDLPPMKSHASVDRRLPTILDARTPTFLQLRHLGQDTADEGGLAALRATLGQHPPVEDVEEVLARFPSLRAVLAEATDPVEQETPAGG